MTPKSKTSPLEFALNFEVKGVGMYMKLASQTDNPLGKELFYSLAAEEIDHARRIDEISRSLRQGGSSWKSIMARKIPSLSGELKKFFLKTSRKELKGKVDNLKGYRLAMEMERKGFAAYEKFHEQADTDAEREFFKLMMREENEHLAAIANVYV